MHFLKKILIIAILAGALYLLLGYHYIIIDKSVKMLKKSELTLKYTVFSTKAKSTEAILSIRELWIDGIGNLLLKEGKITQEEFELFKNKMEGTLSEEELQEYRNKMQKED
jgi:hypothetical protein